MPDGTLVTAALVGQLVGAVGMAGVLWVVQLVHYPLMAVVPESAFPAYAAGHTTRITWVVGPLMAVEGVATLILLARPPADVAGWLPWAGAVSLAIALAVTALVSAPLHGRLSVGFDPQLHDRLVRTNWIRTAAWSAHAAVAVAMVA
jgi:hypothetical protein